MWNRRTPFYSLLSLLMVFYYAHNIQHPHRHFKNVLNDSNWNEHEHLSHPAALATIFSFIFMLSPLYASANIVRENFKLPQSSLLRMSCGQLFLNMPWMHTSCNIRNRNRRIFSYEIKRTRTKWTNSIWNSCDLVRELSPLGEYRKFRFECEENKRREEYHQRSFISATAKRKQYKLIYVT